MPLLRRSFVRRSLLSWAVLDPSTLCHLPGSTVFWTSHCVWTEFLVTGLPGGTTSHMPPASVYLMPSQDVSPVESEHTLLMVHGRLQALCPGSNENSIPVIQGPPSPHCLPYRKRGSHSVPIPTVTHYLRTSPFSAQTPCPHALSAFHCSPCPCGPPWGICFSISLFLQVDSAQPESPSPSWTHSKCLIIAPSQLTCHLLREAPAKPTLRSELASVHDCHSTP